MKVVKTSNVSERKVMALISPVGGLYFRNRENELYTGLDNSGEAVQGRLEFKCLSESHGWVKIYEGESITITF